MPTRADIEAATPRCQASRRQPGIAHANFGRRGGFIRGTIERLCLEPMRYSAVAGLWMCECGATQSGAALGARAAAFAAAAEAEAA
jgi:hypothetical protein